MIIETLQGTIFPIDYLPLTQNDQLENIFSSFDWINNFLQTVVSSGDELFWIGCKSVTGTPLLLLPLWRRSEDNRLWGKKLTSLANYYTTLYEPIHALSDDTTLTQALDRVASAVCLLHWDVLDIYPLDPASVNYQLLIDAFRRQRKYVTPYFIYGNWFFLTNSQSFDDYWISRPSQLKNTLKRKANKLKTKDIEYRIVQHPEEVVSAVALYEQTYHASWKQDEPYPNFIPGLAQMAAEQGWLRLGLLFIDQEIAAAQLWLTVADTAYIFKLCQKPDFDQYSPGSLLTVYLMKHVIDIDKVRKVDFLSGDDHYKKDWMTQREERWGLQIANPKSFFGLLKIIKNSLQTLKSIKNFI